MAFHKLGLSVAIAALTFTMAACGSDSDNDSNNDNGTTIDLPVPGNDLPGNNGNDNNNGTSPGDDGNTDNGSDDSGNDDNNSDDSSNSDGDDSSNSDGSQQPTPITDEDAVNVISDDTYDGGISLDQKVKGTAGAALQTGGNPFDDAYFYVNPDIKVMMDSSLKIVAAAGDNELLNKVKYVQRQPSAVWMDSIAAISGDPDAGRRSLESHLDSALAQQAFYAKKNNSVKAPMTVVIIVYNLPDRDCAAFASNGKLIQVGKNDSEMSNGFERYKTDYIAKIADVFSQEKYQSLRIVAMLEPDSFPNMITNTDYSELNPGKPASLENDGYCNRILEDTSHGFVVENEGDGTDNPNLGIYGAGLRLAIQKFAEIDNVYTYLDIGHAGWLGWDNDSEPKSNMKRAVRYFKQLVDGADGIIDGKGLDLIRGFASNTSGYTPLEEPLISNAYSDRSALSSFYQFNPAVDELTYIDMLQKYFTSTNADIGSAAFEADKLGFIIDTARNGWGFDGRPTPAQSNRGTDASKRVDQRPHRGHWCNIDNAGIGEVPKASPDAERPYLDTFFWMKPPGESDGISFDHTKLSDAEINAMDAIDQAVYQSATNPVYAGKSLDTMCIPGSKRENVEVDVIDEYAPHAGAWFHKQFIMLIDNAYPALGESDYD